MTYAAALQGLSPLHESVTFTLEVPVVRSNIQYSHALTRYNPTAVIDPNAVALFLLYSAVKASVVFDGAEIPQLI